MGTIYAQVRIGNLNGGDTFETQALVDTEATDSAFPADLLEHLHIQPGAAEPVTYVMANGEMVECARGQAMLTIDIGDGGSVSGICPVAFWPDENGQCIGSTTLQVLMLAVDAHNERLVKVSTARRGWAGVIE